MRICIHKGTQQIGGTCVEIESHGQRLVLEVGLPLDATEAEGLLPPIPGFKEADETLLGVVISHPHQDHYGLAKTCGLIYLFTSALPPAAFLRLPLTSSLLGLPSRTQST